MPRAVPLGIVASVLIGCGGGSPARPASRTAAVASASSLEQQFVRVVKEVQPEVVQIRAATRIGSGVIFDAAGDIVTNAHVVGDSTRFLVAEADGRRGTARLVGTFSAGDLAVIKLEDAQPTKPARFADSSKAEVGNIVLAAGNPLGLQSSVTDGIVSGLGRTVTESRGVVLPNAIQTSAPINPGNSGGALVDLEGRVIGIPTIAAADPRIGASAAGIGFAIPSNTVTDIAQQIVLHGRVVSSRRAALGMRYGDAPSRSGALVAALVPGGPADRVGILAGDYIDGIAGKAVVTAESLAVALAGLRPGQRVTVSVRRTGGTSLKLSVMLGELAAPPG